MAKLVWHTHVTDVREKSLTVSGKKSADGKAELQTESAGWWITLGHSPISLYVGMDRPSFCAGDAVSLILEHEQENSSNASEKTKSKL